jgi:CubicO group peptidase (beta-lactamase class C family)
MRDAAKLQFRVLYREFLFRMVDLELLARQGDMRQLLGQLAALLIFVSVMFSIPALSAGSVSGVPAQIRLGINLTAEHFMIATTMLVVGLFAVLSWDSTFPNRRDVFVLAPLPLRARTLFLAKIAAVGTALSLTVFALHLIAGMVWPIVLQEQTVAQTTPALTYDAALPPVDLRDLGAVLDRDLAHARSPGGALAPETGVGAVAGVLRHGERRIFAYGVARPAAIFEIGSIGKTFTALLLAKMAVEGKVDLGDPVRSLLPPGTVAKPLGREISLLDLATHHSGLPPWPKEPDTPANSTAGYGPADLYAALAKLGVARPPNTSFAYSNFGFCVLGEALANRAGTRYRDLLSREIAGPLGLRDTVAALSAEQRSRLIQGYDRHQQPVHPRDIDPVPGSGGIRSTAGDMLTYLEAQLHPEKIAAGALPEAIAQSHLSRAEVGHGIWIGLAWLYRADNGTYFHGGRTEGYSSWAFFDPRGDYAAVVLVNRYEGAPGLEELLSDHIRARVFGEPAVSLDSVAIPASGGFLGLVRCFAVYWTTMFAAGAFVFCFVLGVQGLAAQLLPRRWFLRASSFLQLAAFCALVSGYMLEPMVVDTAAILAAHYHGPFYWSPAYWFLGLFQQLSGSPALAPQAHRAWWGLAICVAGTAGAYVLSYWRTLRRIVEEPDIVPTSRHVHWLPRFGKPLTTALAQFSIRTLARSRQHRMMLAFYWGVACALVVLLLKNGGGETREDIWHQPSVPLLVASGFVLGAAILAVRVVASMPLELRANWVFRITPVQGGAQTAAAVRRAFYVLGLVPAWSASACVFLWGWPWRPAVGHLAVLGLVGIAATELCLAGFHKIPFTCSYLPGKSRANMAFLAFVILLCAMIEGAKFERRALGDAASFAGMAALLAVVAAGARWWAHILAKSAGAELRFEEEPAPAIFALDLHRDGAPPATGF